MENVEVINGSLVEGKIIVDLPPAEIYTRVMSGTVMVIKNVFPDAMALNLKSLAFSWGRGQQTSTAEKFFNLINQNHFCVQHGVSKFQKTLHHYNSYNFNNLSGLQPDELRTALQGFGVPLKNFYNEVTGNEADFTNEGKSIHPQILHYPAGGGFFAKHFHPLEPQKIGVITSLSRYGEDHKTGGTGFEVNSAEVNIEALHNVGDIALFRYDLAHWVSSVDIEDAIDPQLARGRWTLVIPYY